jgi:hypothetical protein
MKKTPSTARRALFGLIAAYLGVQALYVPRLPLVMDEFQGARAAWRLLADVPYRDFTPYKTVLGYYLQLPALTLLEDPWLALLATKLWTALLGAAALAAGALLLMRRLAPAAVVVALAMALAMSDFLERSADLRVDLLTSVVGFLGLLALLAGRPLLGGALSGAAFLVSQKAAYALVAGAVGLALEALARRERRDFGAPLRFALGATATVAAYLGFWSLFAAPERVFRATFFAHGQIAFGDLYRGIRRLFWLQTLERNPAFWALAALALVVLARQAWQHPRDARRPVLLAGYGATMLLLGVWHRQPWPYFFVLLVPTVFVLHAACFDLVAPAWTRLPPGRRWAAGLLLAFFALGWPLARLPVNLGRDASVQAATVRLGEALLPEGESYLAGLDLLWRRVQSPPELAWLDQVRLRALRRANATEIAAVREAIERRPPRLLIANARLQSLPRPLLASLGRRYQPLHGNLLGYAPLIESPGAALDWPLAGRFRVERASPGSVRIAEREIGEREVLELQPGRLSIETEVPIRLVWEPQRLQALADPRFAAPAELFPNVYSY